MKTVNESLKYADDFCSSESYMVCLAAEVRRLRSEIDSAREELQSFVAARNEWKQRAEAAEAALKEAREQPAVAWLCGKDVTTHKEYAEWFMRFTQEDCTQLYAGPVPDAPAVAVPEMTDDALKEMLNAAQIVGYDDPLRIVRGFAMRVLQEWGNQEGMHKAFLDAVNPAVAAPAVPSGWNIRRDGDVLIVQHPDIGGCSIQKEPDWERMIPEAILYSLADALLQSRAVKDSLTAAPDCRTCANRGQVNGLSQESYCDSCVYEGRGWRQNHFVDAVADRLLEGGE